MALDTFVSQTYFSNTILQYLYYLGILAASVIAGKVVTWLSKTIIKPLSAKTKTKADDLVMELLEAPVLFTIFVVAFWLARSTLTLGESARGFYDNILSILVIINIAWYATRLIGSAITHYVKPLTNKTETDLDDHLVPIAKKLINVIIIVIAGIMVIDKFGYNVGSLLAGLGLGGLAFALAAQDLVGNLFGGIAILTDKPFKFGDRIKVDTVDGFVREIGLRTTRVETLAGTMMVVPNSKVVNSIVENISDEPARRMMMTIGVEYGTSLKKLEQAKEIIRRNVKRVKGLKDDCLCAFTEFADSSLNILTIYWITKEGMEDYFGVQDDLLMSIKKEFERAKISMAFPTQTVHVKK